VLKYKPRVIVFYSGDNDIAGGKSAQRVFDDFQKFVQLVHDELPDTRILVLSIKPSIARLKLWPAMKEANALLAKLADNNEHLEYVDIAAPMLGPDGQPRKELFRDDGLHLSAAGYELWNETLRPALKNLNGN
jgi:lysophospholipase L1-like esterase